MKASMAKKRVGRPRTGKMPQTGIKLPTQLLNRIDKLAREQKLSRGEIIRRLLTKALNARDDNEL
jgi:metal-responsive CopG/Arc/MetJ family transcriptional regulator